MPFGPVDPRLDLVALEERVLEYWDRHSIRQRVAGHRDGGERWIFYEGPPTANGRPGLHHVWARVFKDLYPRFQTMRGKSVPRKGGWDCHGLPVEIEVEKELGLTDKAAIEAFGIAEFNERCRASVSRYVQDWKELTERSGTWIDVEDAYWTLTPDYVESVWWLVQQMWDRDLLYEGHRVTPYCGRCGTALSSHEVAQGYQDVVDPSIYVRFPLVDDDADLLVWTTTPWTLLSNTGAAVAPDLRYVRVRDAVAGRDLWLAEGRLEALFGDADGQKIVERATGDDLVGRRYIRPFDTLAPPDGADGWRIVAGKFVTVADGSGIVHLAPAFGVDDMDAAAAEGLPVLNPLTVDGTYDNTAGPWAGRFVKDADRDLISDLESRGLLVREEPYEHSYPHCWRCGSPLLYWAKTSWFVRTSEQRPALVGQNATIGWHPQHIRDGRFGDWLANNVDWALSRDRYWGTPLPIWRCQECQTDRCFGSLAELGTAAGTDLSGFDPHRPQVDDVLVPCEETGCGGSARRVSPVLDAWFDSGAMPSAQHHHPFAADDRFSEAFPADFICEAIDQTRGWFYSLLAVNTLVFGQTPFRNVVCLGLLVDETGAKMSKSKGNVIDPWTIFSAHGADALRWYFLAAGQPWTPRRVFEDGIRESTRKTLLTLWNVWTFFATYADLDGWDGADQRGGATPSHVLDRWILSELDDTVVSVTEALDDFDALAATTRLTTFVDDLSNWYVRRSRSRFWGSEDDGAHLTLHTCLEVVARLLAPMCPFLAEELWRGLTGGDSVHLADWPEPTGARDPQLSESMSVARRVVALGRAARTDSRTRVRQPLRRARVQSPDAARLDDALIAEIAAELNVHEVQVVDDLTDVQGWMVTPNFKVLGPRLGARLPEIQAALAAGDGSALKAALDVDGFVEIAGARLESGDVEVRVTAVDDVAVAEESGTIVALDLEIDDDLRSEGRAREMIRAINDLRKERGLHVSDRIVLTYRDGGPLADALIRHAATVAREVLASEVVTDGITDHEMNIDGESMAIGIRVA